MQLHAQQRMSNPALFVPGALQALLAVDKSTHNADLPDATRKLVHLRASQINGCGVCVDMHARELRQLGESDERIAGVAAWRETPYFTNAELAARSDPLPDGVWDDAADHYDEKELAGLVLSIAAINAWNRINATTRQIAG